MRNVQKHFDHFNVFFNRRFYTLHIPSIHAYLLIEIYKKTTTSIIVNHSKNVQKRSETFFNKMKQKYQTKY